MSTQILATLGVDAVDLIMYAGGRYAVIQRDPEPDDTAVPLTAGVALRVVDLEGDPATPGIGIDFDIYVDGGPVLSYAGGTPTWDPAWFGLVTPAAGSAPYYYVDVVALQAVPPMFTSEQSVPVRVIVTPGPSPDLDTTYTFTTVDVTAPSVMAASAVAPGVVRVQFSEAMAVDGVGSVLLPSAYQIVARNVDPAPAVALEVTSVSVVAGSGDTAVDLVTQWEHTPGCEYEITVAATVTDAAGNAIQ